MAMKIFGSYMVYVYDHAGAALGSPHVETLTCFDSQEEAGETAQDYANEDKDGSCLIAVYQLIKIVRDPKQDLAQDEGIPS